MRGERHGQRGSALLLVPAVVLVLTVLASLALDQAIVADDQRRLVLAAEAAAADGITAGVDVDHLRATGDLRWDPGRTDRAVRRAVALAAPGATVRWRFTGTTLTVWLRRSVRLVFAPALDRRARTRTVSARASAVLPIR